MNVEWRDIREFDSAEYGTDGMLFRVRWSPNYLSTVYGWYDPDVSLEFPWRVIDQHDPCGAEAELIMPNGFKDDGSVVQFCPLTSIK